MSCDLKAPIKAPSKATIKATIEDMSTYGDLQQARKIAANYFSRQIDPRLSLDCVDAQLNDKYEKLCTEVKGLQIRPGRRIALLDACKNGFIDVKLKNNHKITRYLLKESEYYLLAQAAPDGKIKKIGGLE